MSLDFAKKGYEYQDYFTAFVIAKNLLCDNFSISIDNKEYKNDCFDDITLINDIGKAKYQIRHNKKEEGITEGDFKNNSGFFSLDKLVNSFILNTSNTVKYFLVTTKKSSGVSFLENGNLKNYLNVSNLYKLKLSCLYQNKKVKWATLKNFSKKQISNFNENFFLLPNFPNQEALKDLILKTLTDEIGIGIYPNNVIPVKQVLEKLLLYVYSNRSSGRLLNKQDVLSYLEINTEYGNIQQKFPFVPDIYRLKTTNLLKQIVGSIEKERKVILTGLPGSGKSHLFDDLYHYLNDKNIVAINYYCYLQPTDEQIQKRILTDSMFGTLNYQLYCKFPEIGKDLKRRYSADKEKLEDFIEALSKQNKKVVIMVDGLDHIERIVGSDGLLSSSIIDNFIDDICNLNLQKDTTLFLSSQNNNSLKILQKKIKCNKVYEMVNWDRNAVLSYSKKRNLDKIYKDNLEYNQIIDLIVEKSEGNALYTAYILNSLVVAKDGLGLLKNLPNLNKEINNYYIHLLKSINKNDVDVAETLALLDFSIEQNDFFSIFSGIQRTRIKNVLHKIDPIVQENKSRGGIRVYHESFKRFILEKAFKNNKKNIVYNHIIDWLMKKDFFEDERSYKYLFSYLQKGNKEKTIFNYFNEDFLTNSLYYFYPQELISANLSIISYVASKYLKWGILAMTIELNRALHTYVEERGHLYDLYTDVFLKIFGADFFSNRLKYDGKPIFGKFRGIQLCQYCDLNGGEAPWNLYSVVGESINIKEKSDLIFFQDILSAHFLKQIRLSENLNSSVKIFKNILTRHIDKVDKRIVELMIQQLFHIYKKPEVVKELEKIKINNKIRKYLYLFIAEYYFLNKEPQRSKVILKDIKDKIQTSEDLLRSYRCEYYLPISKNRINKFIKLFDYFNEVNYIRLDQDEKPFGEFIQMSQILAFKNEKILNRQISKIKVDGWYRAWLIFLIKLSIIETRPKNISRDKMLIRELTALLVYAKPFQGSPRACDLYAIRKYSNNSFERVLLLVADNKKFQEIQKILEKVSNSTTTTLQGSPDGPLTNEVFSAILLNSISKNAERNNIIEKAINEQIELSGLRTRFYEIQAEEHLKYANALILLNKISKAKKVYWKACQLLTGYGFRKDATLFEIIRPLKYIAINNKSFALKGLELTYPLSHAAALHTDGKTTQWSLNIWFNALMETDTRLAIKYLIDFININSSKDWRIEGSSQDLFDYLIDKANIKVLIDFYETLTTEEREDIDFEPKFKFLTRISQAGDKYDLEKFANIVARNLAFYEYQYTDKIKHVKVLRKFLKLIKNINVSLNKYYKDRIINKIKKYNQDDSGKSFSSPYKKEPIKSLSFYNKSKSDIYQIIENNYTDTLLHRKNLIPFAKYLAKINFIDAEQIIKKYFQRITIYNGENQKNIFEAIKLLKKKDRKKIACLFGALGFFYSRGDNSWCSLGDSNAHYLLSEAIKIDKRYAFNILSGELALQTTSPSYFIGAVRHLIEYFSKNNLNDNSILIWNGAYKIINNRLLFLASHNFNSPELKISQLNGKNINKLLTELSSARKKCLFI